MAPESDRPPPFRKATHDARGKVDPHQWEWLKRAIQTVDGQPPSDPQVIGYLLRREFERENEIVQDNKDTHYNLLTEVGIVSVFDVSQMDFAEIIRQAESITIYGYELEFILGDHKARTALARHLSALKQTFIIFVGRETRKRQIEILSEFASILRPELGFFLQQRPTSIGVLRIDAPHPIGFQEYFALIDDEFAYVVPKGPIGLMLLGFKCRRQSDTDTLIKMMTGIPDIAEKIQAIRSLGAYEHFLRQVAVSLNYYDEYLTPILWGGDPIFQDNSEDPLAAVKSLLKKAGVTL